jgi:hypothetical protein
MIWSKTYHYLPRYEYTSTNQHGVRYKKVESKRVSVATLNAVTDDASELQRLILLSHHLDVPVRYDFKDHKAFIQVVGKEAL